MQSQVSVNHFELFGISASFDIDEARLTERYRELQRSTHPDRFANASDRERRLSVQRAAQVNDAFQTLSSPLLRARYLLDMRGVALDDTESTVDPEFLMEQMELREALEDARHSENPEAALNHLMQEVESRLRDINAELQALFSDGGDDKLADAAVTVRKMQFLQRLHEEVQELEDELAQVVGE